VVERTCEYCGHTFDCGKGFPEAEHVDPICPECGKRSTDVPLTDKQEDLLKRKSNMSALEIQKLTKREASKIIDQISEEEGWYDSN